MSENRTVVPVVLREDEGESPGEPFLADSAAALAAAKGEHSIYSRQARARLDAFSGARRKPR